MKKCIILVVVFALAAGSFGSLLPAELRELSVSGLLDFDTAAGTLVDLDIFFGYFIRDYLEVGIEASVRDDDVFSFWSAGLRTEYNFDLGTELVPYLGLSLSYGEVDSDLTNEGSTAVILGGQAGVKYFLTEYLALSAAAVLEAATDNVFANDHDFDSTNAKIDLGIRCFF